MIRATLSGAKNGAPDSGHHAGLDPDLVDRERLAQLGAGLDGRPDQEVVAYVASSR